jgi:hypothetical protein
MTTRKVTNDSKGKKLKDPYWDSEIIGNLFVSMGYASVGRTRQESIDEPWDELRNLVLETIEKLKKAIGQ